VSFFFFPNDLDFTQKPSYPNLIKTVFDCRSFILYNGQLHINRYDILLGEPVKPETTVMAALLASRLILAEYIRRVSACQVQ
jgi:hypothetical protein